MACVSNGFLFYLYLFLVAFFRVAHADARSCSAGLQVNAQVSEDASGKVGRKRGKTAARQLARTHRHMHTPQNVRQMPACLTACLLAGEVGMFAGCVSFCSHLQPGF